MMVHIVAQCRLNTPILIFIAEAFQTAIKVKAKALFSAIPGVG